MVDKDWVVSIDEVAIAPGDTVTVETEKLSVPFFSQNLLMIETVPLALSIISLCVGGKPQAGMSEEADATKVAMFAPLTLGNGFTFRCMADQKISLRIRNDADVDVKVSATFFGRAGG